MSTHAMHEPMHAKRKRLTKEKARKILHDGKVRGKPLTEKARKFMGAMASGERPKK